MTTSCLLCEQPASVRAIGARVVTGNTEHPDGAILCRRCTALPADEQRALRERAMERMLREEKR